MARLDSRALDEILERDMPGFVVVQRPAADTTVAKVEADETGPSIDELRAKYLGADAAGAAAVTDAAADDEEIVLVQPRGGSMSHAKRVVVSSKSASVIGTQG
jgi:hypothetical protein